MKKAEISVVQAGTDLYLNRFDDRCWRKFEKHREAWHLKLVLSITTVPSTDSHLCVYQRFYRRRPIISDLWSSSFCSSSIFNCPVTDLRRPSSSFVSDDDGTIGSCYLGYYTSSSLRRSIASVFDLRCPIIDGQ